jgi:hypothetical protein
MLEFCGMITRYRTFMMTAMALYIAMFSAVSAQSDLKPASIDFDNAKLHLGNIHSREVSKPGGMGLGFSGEFSESGYYFGTSADFNFNTKKFVCITFDVGGAAPFEISPGLDGYFGISTLSVNLSTWDASPINCAFIYKCMYKKVLFEGKTTFFGWRKGKDPVLRENGFYSLSYRFDSGLALGVNYKLIAKNAQFLNAQIAYVF